MLDAVKGDETVSLSLEDIERARAELGARVLTTPVLEFDGSDLADTLTPGTRVALKLEMLQPTGSFKVRAAFLNMLRLSVERRRAGVVAASAGNHAIAVAYAAQALGSSAKLVMFAQPNPLRLALCRRFDAEVIVAKSAHHAFEIVEAIAAREGRAIIPPYEGLGVALGTATVALEFCRQTAPLDAVIVPIGGGGLAAGVAAGVKAIWPHCEIHGAEPIGASTMYESLRTGALQVLKRADTIADSLAAPHTLPISFDLCQRSLTDVHLVSDEDMRIAMRRLAEACKLVVEPAGAAPLAALLGPLGAQLRGRRIGLVVSGANIDTDTFSRLVGFDDDISRVNPHQVVGEDLMRFLGAD